MNGVKKVNCKNCGKVLERPIQDERKVYYCNRECRMKGLQSDFKEKREKRPVKSVVKRTFFKKSGCKSCRKKKSKS